MGQLAAKVRTEGSKVLSVIKFQVAKVRKPLLAVSGMVDKGNMVVFDAEGSYILPKDAKHMAQIRQLIRQTSDKIPMHREKGVFILKTEYHQDVGTEQGFSRQGVH